MASALSAGQIAGLIGGSSLLSFGGNLATSAINSSRAWKYTSQAMHLQDNLNRKFYQWTGENGPSFSRKGYEQAGYNPLLALGSNLTPSGALYSGNGANADSDNGSQAVQSAIDAMRIRNENKLAKTQAKVNESQADLNTQQTYKTLADEIASRANSAVATATEQKILNDIYWNNETNREIIKRIKAETRFTNERARGYSASSSDSKHFGAGAFSVKGDYSSAKSSSKSW